MNDGIKKNLRILFILLSLAGSYALYAHDENQHAPQEVSDEYQPNSDQDPENAIDEKQIADTHNKIIEALQKNAIEQLEKIDFILEHIGGRINNKSIVVLDPNTIRHSIKQLRGIINTLRSNAYVYTTQKNLSTILTVNTLLIEQINAGFDTNLTTIPPLDMIQLITRTEQPSELSQTITQLTANDTALQQLYTRAQNFGLNSFNRAFRTLEGFNKKYNLISKIAKTTFILATLGYILYKLPDGLFDASKKSDDPTEESLLNYIQKNMGNSKEEKRKSLMTFARLPRPAGADGSWLRLNSDASWLKKRLYAIKQTLGKKPTIKNGLITQAGTGLYGRTDTILQGILLSAQHLGIAQLAPLLVPFFKDDIKQAGKFAVRSWNKLLVTLRGTKKVAHQGFAKNPEVSFKDIIGNEHIKETFAPVIEYICDPKKFDQPGIPPEKGYLMAGDSRTGKTFLAEALAGEIQQRLAHAGKSNEFAFIKMPASKIAEYGIDYILSLAKAAAPCVLFIDEIDLLRLQRDRDSEALSKFLTSMSGCLDNDPENQVIILAATNRPEHLDFALRQPGRFGELIRFEYPTFKERHLYLQQEFEKRCLHQEMFDLEQIAYETEGCSYDGIKSIIVSAMQRSKLRHTIVCQADFTAAIDEKIRHIIPMRKQLPEEEQRSIATYQAARAVAISLLQPERIIVKVTTQPITASITEESIYQKNERPQLDIKYGEVFSFLPQDALNLSTKESKEAQIKTLLAGHVGAELMNIRTYNYCMDDTQKALKLAQELIIGGIIRKEDLSHAKQEEILEKAYNLIQQYKEELWILLDNNMLALETITSKLLQTGSLSGKEIRALIHTQKTDKESAPQETKV
ncbi:MAG: AAA family ATPase [Candidatus Babeliales bacterium]